MKELWLQNSRIELHNEDAFFQLQNIDDNSIDCIVTDPPYGIGFKDIHSDVDNWDSMKESDYIIMLQRLFEEFERILVPGGQAWMFYGITMIESVLKAFHGDWMHPIDTMDNRLQINWENALVYARNKGRGSSKKLKSLREEILHMSKGSPKKWNMVEYCRRVVVPYVKDGKPRGWALDISTGEPMRFTGLGNVAFFTAPSHNNKYEKQIHSCQKPLLLNCALMMLSTEAGDTVLDPFMGSGSSAVASILCDRNYIGIEKEKEVFKKAEKWISSVDYESMGDEYIKRRLSSTEPNFKFGDTSRHILPKTKKRKV